ncbi:MAG: hypothetical protein JST68_06635 [Bacteroidetes bacterium]|nr:hypothetical protein [Bacteroidota bacterium]
MKPLLSFILSAFLLILANLNTTAQNRKDTFRIDPSNPVLPPPKHNSEDRSKINKEPVAEFREPTGHFKGNFIVKLYETSKTMRYRIDVEYDGLPGDDTLRFPDLGTLPRPILKKGTTPLSCIIGFLDNDNVFREVKLVAVTPKGNQFKITTLRHWHVSTHYRLVSN